MIDDWQAGVWRGKLLFGVLQEKRFQLKMAVIAD